MTATDRNVFFLVGSLVAAGVFVSSVILYAHYHQTSADWDANLATSPAAPGERAASESTPTVVTESEADAERNVAPPGWEPDGLNADKRSDRDYLVALWFKFSNDSRYSGADDAYTPIPAGAVAGAAHIYKLDDPRYDVAWRLNRVRV